MTIVVDWDVKPQIKQNKNLNCWHFFKWLRVFAEFLREISRRKNGLRELTRNLAEFSPRKFAFENFCSQSEREKRAFFLGWSVCGKLNDINAKRSEIYGYTSQVCKKRTTRWCDSLMCPFPISFLSMLLETTEWSPLNRVAVQYFCHLKLKYIYKKAKTIVLFSNKNLLSNTEPFFLLRVFRWRRAFVVWNLRICWFTRLANHLHFLKNYKLSLRRCA